VNLCVIGPCVVLVALALIPRALAQEQPNRCAVVLHGLARTSASMAPVRRHLLDAGWSVVNQGYPSRRAPIEVLADYVELAIDECLHQGFAPTQIDMVTHSMGAILVRQWRANNPHMQIGRTVMLAPPNHGSELVDRLARAPAFRLWNGPAGRQLGTDSDAIWRVLPGGDSNWEVGVIAAVGGAGTLLGRHLPSPNDGKVSLASTRLAGMRDHVTVRASHTFIMREPLVLAQILSFLRRGMFERSEG